ncbi:MAG: hypothetical protein ACJA1F_000234 [Paracoccaceae bacterium]|jgi:hypothetical protein
MTTSKDTPARPSTREDRLKQALKANLQRRKSQAKARVHGDDDDVAQGGKEENKDG